MKNMNKQVTILRCDRAYESLSLSLAKLIHIQELVVKMMKPLILCSSSRQFIAEPFSDRYRITLWVVSIFHKNELFFSSNICNNNLRPIKFLQQKTNTEKYITLHDSRSIYIMKSWIKKNLLHIVSHYLAYLIYK